MEGEKYGERKEGEKVKGKEKKIGGKRGKEDGRKEDIRRMKTNSLINS